MEWNEVIGLREHNKFIDIANMADGQEVEMETDINMIIIVAEAYRETKQFSKSIQWYIRALNLGADEDILTPLSELYRLTWQNNDAWNELYNRVLELPLLENQKLMLEYEKLRSQKASVDTLISVLTSYVEEELFELHLIELAELYIKNGEEKKAKKLLKKCLRFSDHDVYIAHGDLLLKAIKEGNSTEIVESNQIRSEIYGQQNNNEQFIKTDKELTKEEEVNKPSNIKRDEIDNRKEKYVSPIKEKNKEKPKESERKKKNLTEIYGQKKKKKRIKKEIIGSIESIFKDVVGMEPIKEELQAFYNVLQFQNSRINQGIKGEILKTNFVITGERGSGKTLVTEMLSGLMEMFGIVTDDSIIEVNPRDLQETYSKGGIQGLLELFSNIEDVVAVIDNIDKLFDNGEKEEKALPLSEGIAELMKERKNSLVIIVTGTKKSMEAFLNKELENLIYGKLEIPMYTDYELLQLIKLLANKKQFRISDSASKALLKRIQIERNLEDFSNAITLNAILNDAIKNMASRYMAGNSEENEAMVIIEEEDFELESTNDESIGELLNKLDRLTGLQSVKKDIRNKIDRIIAQQEALELGSSRSGDFGTLHMVFKGTPGTGKTTVARIVGKIYHLLGILPRGDVFVECTRKDLVGEYQGHTATKTHNKFKEALGGVLFIDEAYSLVHGDGDTYGKEAVDTLIADIENYRDTVMVIVAGYPNEMDEFLLHNPGMSSRISNEIVFEDYTIDEMLEIFKSMIKDKGLILDRNTSSDLKKLIEEKSKVRDFGNARGVRNLVDKVRNAMDQRLVEMQLDGEILSKNDYEIIKKPDIEAVSGQKTKEEESLQDLMDKLNAMTGLDSVKNQIKQMVAMIKLKKKSEELNIGTKESFGSLHLVFKGNAGTGKTTIARILGQIYEKLGVLPKGDVFVECSRTSLIGQYQGHTTERVKEKVKEAEGGILFIDEAYDLCHGDNDDFGKEIVTTLLKAIEDKRDQLMVIMAGYSDKLEEFFKTNQGLKSRMANDIIFEDYTLEELVEIFYYMVSANNLKVEEGLEDYVKKCIETKMQSNRDFGNARGVRNIYDEVYRKRALRLSEVLDSGQYTHEQLITIIKEDFQ